MSVKGVFLSDSGIQGELQQDFASAVLMTVPGGNAPFFALSAGMPSSDLTGSFIKNWFDETHNPGRLKVMGTQNSSATTVVVDDGSATTGGTFMLVESTGELVYVVSVATNTLTITRGFADTTPDTITINHYLQRIGTAFEDASDAPEAVTDYGSPHWNVAQVFRNNWNVSGTAQALNYRTGPAMARSKQTASLMHAEDIERALWFGHRWVGTKGGKAMRTMNGVDAMVTTNVLAASSTTSWAQFDAFLMGLFSKNIKGKPNERVAFGGNAALGVLNQIARKNAQVVINPGQTDFGMNIYKWISPYGNISLLTHPMFNESPLWTKDIRFIHPGAMEMCYLRRTRPMTESPDGTDATAGGYLTELTLMLNCEEVHGRYTGLTAGATDS